MESTLMLVADSRRARIFVADTPSKLQEIEDFVHTESRLYGLDMTSDGPGKASGVAGAGGYAYQGRIDLKEQEAINFAKSLAKHLDEERNSNKFEKLMINSDPSFLGQFRNQLSDQNRKAVCFELDKNITANSIDEIRKYLPEHLT